MNNIEQIIIKLANEQSAGDFNEISVQRTLLDNAIKVVPVLDSVKLTSVGMELYNPKTTNLTYRLLSNLFFTINSFLGSLVFENVQASWNYLEVPCLLDGLKALNFYAVFSTNCNHIVKMRDLLLQHLEPRIDSAVLQAQSSKLLEDCITTIKGLDYCYTIYHDTLGEHIPSIHSGLALFFSKREYADKYIKNHEGLSLSVKKIPVAEFDDFLRSLHRLDVKEFKLISSSDKDAIDISVSEYLKEKTPKYQSVFLNYLLIRTKQTENVEELKNLHDIIWYTACQEMTKTLYLVPIRYNDDQEPIEDKFVHTSLNAAKQIIKLQVEEQIGDSVENYVVNLNEETGEIHPLADQTFDNFISSEVPFYGCEEYSFAHSQGNNTIQLDNVMHLRTIINNDQVWLPLFTDMKTLHNIFGKKVRVGLFTWEDLVSRINDSVITTDSFAREMSGVVINPGLTDVLLSTELVKYIESQNNQSQKDTTENIQKSQAEQIAEEYKYVEAVKPEPKLCSISFTLGIISLVLDPTPITGAFAIIFGILGRKKALKEDFEDAAQKALTAIILGTASVISRVIFIILLLF